ncbi:unnamed protein product [Sphagnum balticum]
MDDTSRIRPIAFRPIHSSADADYLSDGAAAGQSGQRMLVRPRPSYPTTAPPASHHQDQFGQDSSSAATAAAFHRLQRLGCGSLTNSLNSYNNSSVYSQQHSQQQHNRTSQPSTPRRLRQVKRNAGGQVDDDDDYDVVPEFVDLLKVLREKDVELSTLRSHIEHNEESMTRAFHEKERRWQRELGQVLERTRQSESNEARTISEMQRVREDLQRLQLHVNQLESEKYGLQKTDAGEYRSRTTRRAQSSSRHSPQSYSNNGQPYGNSSAEQLRAQIDLLRDEVGFY